MQPAEIVLSNSIRIKVLLLYALHMLGERSDVELTVVMADCGLMNGFDVPLGLGDLVSLGYCSRRNAAGFAYYAITEAGEESLTMFFKEMPHSQEEALKKSAAAFLARMRERQQTPAACRPAPEGGYEVILSIREGDRTQAEFRLLAPDQASAESMVRVWPRTAPRVYAQMMQLFAEAQQ